MIVQSNGSKTKTSAKPAAKKSSVPKTYVVIDYPQNGDVLHSHHYGIRIGAPHGSKVEISIDGGAWQGTRENSGYYWYDWHHIPAGKHQCVARIALADGKYKKSKAVSCQA